MQKYSVLLLVSVISVASIIVYYSDTFAVEEVLSHGRQLLAIPSGQHKDLFPLDESDYWGTLTVTLGLLIAASGGIGGGGMLVPLLILVYGFSPKHAIALSNFCIVGSSITNMVMNLPKRHPNADRPLVDWDLILVMEPLTMAGAVSIVVDISKLYFKSILQFFVGCWSFCQQVASGLDVGDILGFSAGIHHVDHPGEGHVAVPQGDQDLCGRGTERARQGAREGDGDLRESRSAGRGEVCRGRRRGTWSKVD